MERNVFDSIKIGLASPEMIRSWSYGEVKKPETINYRTLKAEVDGLFCEKIFGPTKDWECYCGKYKRIRYKGKTCEKCGVEVTMKKVRRERMGHIELAAPVSHIWYFKTTPCKIGLLLDISPRLLERVLYLAEYIVVDPGNTPLMQNQILNVREYQDAKLRYEDDFRAGMGAEAIQELLCNLDLDALSASLKDELNNSTGQKKIKAIKRLEVVEAFRKSGNRPEWMILNVLPVIPPDIRPLVQLDGGRFATSDLNELYRRVIARNNRLRHLMELHSPDIIVNNEKRMLQEAVDALIDNGRRGKPVTGPNNRTLKSLSEMLRGKQGRFRQNLLGKRVDYSGRSVIVVGPELKLYQCGLPKEMALELFKPFVMKRLVETQKASNIKDAKKKVERVDPEVWDALETVIKEHPVLLNRAPTLHRLSIQAFEPTLVEGRAIKLHPLVCTAFNADFDGDQMPVHVPLSVEAQAEARFLMLSANNLLKPVDGRAVAVPSQDMVLGSYYLTMPMDPKHPEPGSDPEHPERAIHAYRNFDEAMMAHQNGDLGLHTPIKIRMSKEIENADGTTRTITGVVDATLGRLIFNEGIPQDLGFVDRSNPDDIKSQLALEINFKAGKKQLGQIVDRTIKIHGPTEAAAVLDTIKARGYKYSTLASLSISVYDINIPKEKKEYISNSEAEVEKIWEHYYDGELTDEERYSAVIKLWEKTTNQVTEALAKNFDDYNPIKMMADSGARGSMTQMRQLAGMRGLMFATNGKTMELPIKSNFREGMNILDYFVAARGARKSLSDTALKTADSGYLTRRLVDVSQDVIIREEDCHTKDGAYIVPIYDDTGKLEPLEDRIAGRYLMDDYFDFQTKAVIAKAGDLLTDAQAKAIANAYDDEKADVEARRAKGEILEDPKGPRVRSIFRCKAKHGVCAHCYGVDLATGKRVNIGEAVGIIAAQSIGEPGTQLTMRTFHTGGVAASNITQGLPRVEELFEARRPKCTGVITEFAGYAFVDDQKKSRVIKITSDPAGETELAAYAIPYGISALVKNGDYVFAGQPLCEGDLYPNDILAVSGLDAVYAYIIREVQRVYRAQGVDVNDKHVEVIARQMTRKVRIDDGGDTELLAGTLVEVTEFEEANEAIQARIDAGELTLRVATGTPALLGITKAALNTESFLSAASFQETTRVLTEAAIRGRVDHLLGLKENVILGKLIPAGTGMERYRSVEVEKTEPQSSEETAL